MTTYSDRFPYGAQCTILGTPAFGQRTGQLKTDTFIRRERIMRFDVPDQFESALFSELSAKLNIVQSGNMRQRQTINQQLYLTVLKNLHEK